MMKTSNLDDVVVYNQKKRLVHTMATVVKSKKDLNDVVKKQKSLRKQ